MRIGILTSGGDCPGLNAVIRGFAKYVFNEMKGSELIGISDGYLGLMTGDTKKLKKEDFSGILTLGGTILGTSRQSVEKFREGDENLDQMKKNYKELGLDVLVVLGGAGTHKKAAMLSKAGMNIIGIPKTIDNDIYGTDVTFGFHTAVDIATECIDRIHTTAASHGRTMLIEIMGNKVGWLTLYSGVAGGADIILLPEIPYDPDSVVKMVRKRYEGGSSFTIIAIAEGAMSEEESRMKKKDLAAYRAGSNTATAALARYIEEKAGVETRTVVPGHLQRGGSPSPYDRMLSTEMGCYAGKLAQQSIHGVTVAMKGNSVTFNSLADIAGKLKYVEKDDQRIQVARSIGISFGEKND